MITVLAGRIAAIATAMALRKEITGEWPLPVVGTLSIILGFLLILRPGQGAVAVVWVITLYALVAVSLVERCIASLHVLDVLEEIVGAEPLGSHLRTGSEIECEVERSAWEDLQQLSCLC